MILVVIKSMNFIVINKNQSLFIAYTPLPLHSDWLFSDILQEHWYSPDFDDSTWFVAHHGEFPLYSTSRFYRIHLSLNEEALSYSSAVLLGLHGRNLTTLYLNGELLFDNKYYFFLYY